MKLDNYIRGENKQKIIKKINFFNFKIINQMNNVDLFQKN